MTIELTLRRQGAPHRGRVRPGARRPAAASRGAARDRGPPVGEDPARRAQLGRPRARRLPRRRVRVHHVAARRCPSPSASNTRCRDRHGPVTPRPRGRRGRLATSTNEERMPRGIRSSSFRPPPTARSRDVRPPVRRVVRWSDDRILGAPRAHERRAGIRALVEPLVQRRILLGKERVVLYEAVQQFRVAEAEDGALIGCGALHVMWEDLGEVRTLVVDDEWLRPRRRARAARGARGEARELGLTPPVLPDVRGRVLRPARLRGHRRARPSIPTCTRELVRSPRRGRRGVPRPRPRQAEHPRQHPHAEAPLTRASGAPHRCRDDRHPGRTLRACRRIPHRHGGSRRRCTGVVGSWCCSDSSR